MSDISKLSKTIPTTSKSFILDIEGDTTKHQYQGEFECKVMNCKERAAVAKHEAFLNGGVADSLNVVILNLHSQIAYLKYALIKYPSFWRDSDLGYSLYDSNIVGEVYKQVLKFEEDWMREIWGDEHIEDLKSDSDE